MDARHDDLLRVLLGDSDSLLPFARAVVDHLGGSADADGVGELVCDVGNLLRAIQEEEDPLPSTLSRRPEMLASFFQNADLLDPRAKETSHIARLVMEAIGSPLDLRDDGSG